MLPIYSHHLREQDTSITYLDNRHSTPISIWLSGLDFFGFHLPRTLINFCSIYLANHSLSLFLVTLYSPFYSPSIFLLTHFIHIDSPSLHPYFLSTSLLSLPLNPLWPHCIPLSPLYPYSLLSFIVGSDCDGSYTSAMAASVTLHCSLIITIPGLLVIAFYGSFADRYGLKKTLMMPVLGNFMFCGCILLSLSGVMSAFYLHILLFGALCSGLSGDHNLFISWFFVAVSWIYWCLVWCIVM